MYAHNDNLERSPTDLQFERYRRAVTPADMAIMASAASRARRALAIGDRWHFEREINTAIEPIAAEIGARVVRHSNLGGAVLALEMPDSVGPREQIILA